MLPLLAWRETINSGWYKSSSDFPNLIRSGGPHDVEAPPSEFLGTVHWEQSRPELWDDFKNSIRQEYQPNFGNIWLRDARAGAQKIRW
jgi:hypothetical protein